MKKREKRQKPFDRRLLVIRLAIIPYGLVVAFYAFSALMGLVMNVMTSTGLIEDLPNDVTTLSAQDIATAGRFAKFNFDQYVHTTDKPHPDAPNIRVLGIVHAKSVYYLYVGKIKTAVDQADVVLLERGQGYFRAIADYAGMTGKTVYYVDQTANNDLNEFIIWLPIGILFTSTPALFYIRRWHGVLQLYLFAAVIIPAIWPDLIPLEINAITQKEVSRYYSSSWVTEGRTLNMSDEAVKLAAGRKAVLIQGDWHAEGIFWYHDHPNVMRFQRAYQHTLWWWVPRPSEDEVKPRSSAFNDATRR